MQETDFIEQNKAKWQEFEQVLKSANKDPERVTELFIETTDDLSYSRTFYANRSVRVYLNGIAQQVYQVIYKNKTSGKNSFANFWKQELPDALWHNRKTLFFSFVIFVVGCAIGIVSSIYYQDFAQIMLGDEYIAMTKENIANGDPMAVYKSSSPLEMFYTIALNNIRVSFLTFVMGILFGIGTVYVILYNAIMVGTFVYFFVERGLFKESFLAIMLHGTLELSMIVISGAAGFALAKGLLFPGTFSRIQALIKSARNGVMMMIAVSVLLLYAAFIESFLTRHTDIGDFIRILIIFLSVALVVGYFVLYPLHRSKRGLVAEGGAEEMPKSKLFSKRLDSIENQGKMFTRAFDIFGINIKENLTLSLVITILITGMYCFITNMKLHTLNGQGLVFNSFVDLIYPWDTWNNYFSFSKYPILLISIPLLFTVYCLFGFRFSERALDIKSKYSLLDGVNFCLISIVLVAIIGLEHEVTILVMPFIFPIALLWMYVAHIEGKFFLKSFLALMKIIKGNYSKLIGLCFRFLAIQWICYFILAADVLQLLISAITMNVPRNAAYAEYAYMIIYTFIIFFLPCMLLSLNLSGSVLFYYSAKESNEANTLMKAIDQIGFIKRAYGLEKEV